MRRIAESFPNRVTGFRPHKYVVVANLPGRDGPLRTCQGSGYGNALWKARPEGSRHLLSRTRINVLYSSITYVLPLGWDAAAGMVARCFGMQLHRSAVASSQGNCHEMSLYATTL